MIFQNNELELPCNKIRSTVWHKDSKVNLSSIWKWQKIFSLYTYLLLLYLFWVLFVLFWNTYICNYFHRLHWGYCVHYVYNTALKSVGVPKLLHDCFMLFIFRCEFLVLSIKYQYLYLKQSIWLVNKLRNYGRSCGWSEFTRLTKMTWLYLYEKNGYFCLLKEKK